MLGIGAWWSRLLENCPARRCNGQDGDRLNAAFTQPGRVHGRVVASPAMTEESVHASVLMSSCCDPTYDGARQGSRQLVAQMVGICWGCCQVAFLQV